MPNENRLLRSLRAVQKLPRFMQTWARSKAIGRVVKFVGTANIQAQRLDRSSAVFTLKNKTKVQNHIRGIHAMATGLLAETATGLAVGCHLPDDKLPLLKSIRIDYQKIVQGNLRAEVSLPEHIIQAVVSEPRGSAIIPVTITDSAGNEPVSCEVTWAWKLKKQLM
ncbi:MAG: DUF4442 domain-containing protein [Pseudomonadota bacterium]